MRDERVRANRVAVSVDGVPSQSVPEHWLQQVIESNVSPYLPGIRYRHIPLTGELSGRLCIAIAVPQGTTAHQAKDCKYYGRSQFEVTALPDHQIRLRMQRGRSARLQLEIAEDGGVHDTSESYDEQKYMAAPPYEQRQLEERG